MAGRPCGDNATIIDPYHFSPHSLENKLARVRALWRRNLWWRKRHPRTMHIIGLGTGKSGTRSIAALFEKHTQSIHEASKLRIVRDLVDYLDGRMTRAHFVAALRESDRFWQPTVNVANYFGEVPGEVVEAFPDARYIVTIRDCYTWLRSQVTQLVAANRRPPWAPGLAWMRRLRARRFGPVAGASYPPEEAAVRDVGLPPIEAFFRFWAAHNARILDTIPEDRRLVIRTRDIGASIPQIATFAGVSVESLDAGSAHSHKSHGKSFELWKLVDHAHIENLAGRHCSELMRTTYPEITSIADALAAR